MIYPEDHHKIATIIVSRKMAGGGEAISHELPHAEYEDDGGFTSCAQDILHAFETKDVPMLVQGLKAFFELCEEEPHEEGPHLLEGEY